MAGALIITAELAPADFAWLDGLRRQHYPAERNRLPAHLTMFHALPPSLEDEARHRLSAAVRGPAPAAMIAGLIDLGGGVAFRVASEQLDQIRGGLAACFHGALGLQDRGGWRPHVTIQNKVSNREARQLLEALQARLQPRPLGIKGLGLYRYCDGPWDTLQTWPFR